MIQKGVILLVVLLYTAVWAARVKYPEDLQKQVQQLHTSCIEKESLTEEIFKTFDLQKKTPELQCYLKCLISSFKWMDENEVVQYDFIRKNIHESIKDVTLPYLDNCGKKAVGDGKCEKSYNFFHCMNQAEPENWVLT